MLIITILFSLPSGSRKNLHSVLANLSQLNDATEQYMMKKQEMDKVDQKIKSLKKVSER